MTDPTIAQTPTEEISPKPETPLIFTKPDGFELRWSFPDLDISAYVTHITDKARAEVSFYTATVEQIKEHKETLLLAPNQIDFLAPSQKHNLVKQLRNIGHTDDFVAFCDWERKVNNIALAVMGQCRKNIPAVEVRANTEITLAADYIVDPILYKDLPNIIFGDYSSLKTLTAMALAYVAQLPHHKNDLGLKPGKVTSAPCLWLDYEGQHTSFQKQWTAIQRGFILGLEVPIMYKEMTVPLADAVTSVRADMLENHIEHIVIDSLGPAAGGNLNDPEPAMRYHQALRSLGGTSTTLAHNSKDPNTGSKSIFGSVFFSNLARCIWQCKADKDPMSNYALVSLKQVKASLSILHPAVGLAFEFDEQSSIITVTKTDLAGTALAGELPLSLRIKDLLRNGALTLDQISTELGVDRNVVKTTVYRLADKRKEVLIKTGVNEVGIDKWGLKHHEG